jgi:hypothetical protein
MTRVQKIEVADGNKGVHLNVYPVTVYAEPPGQSVGKRDQTTIFQSHHSFVAHDHNADAEPRVDEQIEEHSLTS